VSPSPVVKVVSALNRSVHPEALNTTISPRAPSNALLFTLSIDNYLRPNCTRRFSLMQKKLNKLLNLLAIYSL